MRVFYSDHFRVPLPEGHRFPMDKYARLRERVQQSGLILNGRLQVPEAASDEQLARAHHPAYIHKVAQGLLSDKEVRRIGFPWSPQLVERSRRSVGGTLAACRAALQDQFSANLAGGTHHAYADHGEGFCVFNDVAVAARAMQAESRLQRVVILDCDVHQGNGTAAIFAGDASVFTFSIHGARNFPFHKENSDLDIALPDGTGDKEYLQALESGVRRSLELAKAELAIYLAGADPYHEDRLGRLSVSKAGLAQRDQLVFSLCRQHALPVAIVMSGGYARQVDDTVDIHFQTIQFALEFSKNDHL
ncbi:MAG: histone deacetylase [Anaerolineales bacterium]|nr:MAG: histone deacetylase [Anaerolineales bacterium]